MDQENRNGAQPQEKRYAQPEIDDNLIPWDTDEAPTEWVPTRFEKKIKAIPEDKWELYQTLGGVAAGIAITALLFFAGDKGFNAGMIAAVAIALVLPNWLEKKGRRKLLKARVMMIITLAIGLGAMFVYTGVTHNWQFFTKKEKETAALAWLMKL